jgi:hypothetical protein
VITLGATAAAYVRRRSLPTLALHAPEAAAARWRRGLRYIPAALALCAAVAVAVNGARREPATGFTQLWMLPMAAEGRSVQIGLANMESAPTGYRLELRVAGQRLQMWEQLELGPGATWSTTASLPEQGWAEAILYRQDAPDAIYRRVLLQSASSAEGKAPSP